MPNDSIRKDILIGPVRFSYPNLFKARLNQLSGKAEYSVVVLIEKGEGGAATLQTVKEAIKEIATKAELRKGSRNPLKDGDEDDGPHPGYWYFNAKCNEDYPPLVVDGARNPVDAKAGWTGGDWGNVKVTLYAYNKGGNSGVGVSLRGVQFTRKGEPFGNGGTRPDEFPQSAAVAGAAGSYDPFEDE